MSLRETAHRPVRTVLTVLSVALGTAAVVAVLLTMASVRKAQDAMFATLTGKTDFLIAAEGGASFDAELLDRISQIQGIQAAVPSISRSTILYVGDRRAKTQVVGVDFAIDNAVRSYRVVQGQPGLQGNHLYVDERFAQSMGLKVDDPVRLLTRSGMQEWKIGGLVQLEGAASLMQGGILLAPIATVQSQFRVKKKLDKIELVIDAKQDAPGIRESLASMVPQGLTVKQPVQDNQFADQTKKSAELGLTLAIAFALLIAIFIIFNSFQMSVGERRRQLGILRAIGATRSQIVGFILGESVTLGVLGTLLGCIIAVPGANLLTSAISQVLQSPALEHPIQFWPFAIAPLLGIGIAALGAAIPARRAGYLSPAEAMQQLIPSEIGGSRIWILPAIGALGVALGLLVHAGCYFNHLSASWTIPASISMLLGVVLILPICVEPTSKVVQWLIAPMLGIEARLAHKQLVRNKSRTAMTASVLFIAISSVLGLGMTILDNVRNVDVWCSRALVGDFFIRAAMPDMTTGRSADVPDDLGKQLAALPGVRDISALRFVSARSDIYSVIVVIRDFGSTDSIGFDAIDGTEPELLRGLREDGIVIGSVLGERLKIGREDLLPLDTLNGTQNFKIAGVVNDYIAGGLTVYMDRKTAEQAFQVEGQDAFIINADDGKRLELGTQIAEICRSEGLLFQSNADLVEMIHSMSRGINAGLWGLLALGTSIASFGLMNTLSMNIIEQTREIGMLRVVAMTRQQVRRMIFAQSILLGIVGFLPGAIMGGVVAFLINLSTYAAIGHQVELVFRPGLMIGSVLLAMLMAWIASILPAERAARIHLSTALGYQ